MLTNFFLVSPYNLNHMLTVNNWAQAAGHISTGRKICFCSQLSWTRDYSPRTHFGLPSYRLHRQALDTNPSMNDVFNEMGTT